ncbi:MAG: hypothetical protein WB420_23330, partial [Bradyrhizobium sp.]
RGVDGGINKAVSTKPSTEISENQKSIGAGRASPEAAIGSIPGRHGRIPQGAAGAATIGAA